jgi:hypothetical protein
LNFYLKPDRTPIKFYQKKRPYKQFLGRKISILRGIAYYARANLRRVVA